MEQYPIGDENANHTFDVRLKELYKENLKRLNEFVVNTYLKRYCFLFCRSGVARSICRD